MELKKIEISNFRSIKYEIIEFNHNCLILLGKNEAGKSNILKAIAAVFGKYAVTDKDKRKKINNEKIDSYQYRIHAIISLDENDFNNIIDFLNTKYAGLESIDFKSGISLKEYVIKVFGKLILSLSIGDEKKPALTHYVYQSNDIELAENLFISGNEILPHGTTKLDLMKEVFSVVKEYYSNNSIKCHYWQYSNNFLLPNSVAIQSFIADPSSIKALENIFQLCGRDSIKEEFASAKSEDGDYASLFEQVSKEVTRIFQKIWSDLKGTSIQLIPDGQNILIKISEKAKYNCEDRSDGFKKFISILLMLSTQSRANRIVDNDLILIDEPDQSLYPTSAQFLRNELLTIAEKSKVIFSTHSQYMIDSNNLDRHIIVEKKDDITTLKKEDTNAPYATDELLKRAIGVGIFECIKPINIIFEGYLDKKLFNRYLTFSNLEKDFIEYGQIYLAGISGVDVMVSILSSANKKFIIVADSDDASNSKRKEFVKNHPDHKNNWLAYADVFSSVATMEDFVSIDKVKSEIKNFNTGFVYKNTISSIENISNAVGKDKEKKQEIKNKLVEKLQKDDISKDYTQFVNRLKEMLMSL